MQEFINQAKHNESFHKSLCNLYPDDYFDWKVTCLFYIAIHYLKALAIKRGKKLGTSHVEINRNIKTGTHNPSMPISGTACSNYMILFHYSQDARYDGFDDPVVFKAINKQNYQHALKCLEDFKKFLSSNNIPVNT